MSYVDRVCVESSIGLCLETQYDAGLLSLAQLEAGLGAIALGTESLTIGFEIEAPEDSRPELQFSRELLTVSGHLSPSDRKDLETAITSTGFTLQDDQLFEVSSTPSTHPYALYVALLGLIKAGLVPQTPRAMFPLHISIGSGSPGDSFENRMRVLRSTEIMGASTPERLQEPYTAYIAQEERRLTLGNFSYAQKGQGGLYYELNPASYSPLEKKWVGDNKHRNEYRSLQYQGPNSLLLGLDTLYYLSHAMHADSATDLHELYDDFLSQYSKIIGNSLPTTPRESASDWYDPKKFNSYISPFAELIANNPGQLKRFRGATSATVLSIREALNMDQVWSPHETTLV